MVYYSFATQVSHKSNCSILCPNRTELQPPVKKHNVGGWVFWEAGWLGGWVVHPTH